MLGSLLVVATVSAQALPTIGGTMAMGGSFYALDASGGQTNSGTDAVAIDFNLFGFDQFVVNSADGDFGGLAGSIGAIQDFQFDPFGGPITDFWTVGGFSFELVRLTRGITSDPENFLVLDGVGIVSAAGFADTRASWSFSGDTTGSGAWSWSATSVTSDGDLPVPAPAPGSLVLLLIGLLGIGVHRKL